MAITTTGIVGTNAMGLERRTDHAGILHKRVREQILQDLSKAGIAPGEKYYTETELASRLKVSRNTIRKAMSELEREGYLSRRQRVGTIVGEKTAILGEAAKDSAQTDASRRTDSRERMLVILPLWDDSIDGFHAGQILNHLISPGFSPSWSVEIRHAHDRLEQTLEKGTIVLAIDPLPELILQLGRLADQGVRIIVTEPKYLIPGVVNICTDSRAAVRDTVRRFYDLGHQTVGIINHVQDHHDYRQCHAGYLDAHRDLGRPIHPQGLVQLIEHNIPIIPNIDGISAWVCTYWAAANLVAEQCKALGLTIPEDVSVVSLDDPVDEGIRTLGKRISVIRPDAAATVATIRACLRDWQDSLRGKMLTVPMQKIDRDTIAPPSGRTASRS